MPKRTRINPIREQQLPQPLTLEQWAKEDKLRGQLAELLSHPVMREALRTLEESYTPSVPAFVASDGTFAAPNAADLNNLLALRHVHRAGFFGFLTGLRNLTRERILKRIEKSPWGDLLPE